MDLSWSETDLNCHKNRRRARGEAEKRDKPRIKRRRRARPQQALAAKPLVAFNISKRKYLNALHRGVEIIKIGWELTETLSWE